MQLGCGEGRVGFGLCAPFAFLETMDDFVRDLDAATPVVDPQEAKREKERERSRRRYREDPRVKEAQARWKAKNKDKVNATIARWNVANPERCTLNRRKYYIDHKFKLTALRIAARALERGFPEPDFDGDGLRQIYDVQNGACACCKASFDEEASRTNGRRLGTGRGGWSVDRIDSAGPYLKANIALLCLRCNLIKRDGSAEEHAQIAEFMRSRGAK